MNAPMNAPMNAQSMQALADLLWQAQATRTPIAPLREHAARLQVPPSSEAAYAVQGIIIYMICPGPFNNDSY